MKILFTILSVLISVMSIIAQDWNSVQTGNWNDQCTWDAVCGSGTPGSADNAVISSGHVVTLTSATTIKDLTVNSGATLSGEKNMDVTGNFVINGTYDAKRIITLSGSGTTIDGSGSITNMGGVTISSGNKTILSTANLTMVQGKLTINSGLTVTNYGTITAGDAINGADATATWVNESNSTLNMGKGLLALGVLTASATGNTVNYDRAGAQIIKLPSSSYYHLQLQGNNVKSLAGNTIVLGDLTINSTLDVTANNYSLNVRGNWTNSGTFNERSGTVTFDGSGAQSITNALGEKYFNLTIDKSAGTLNVNDNDTVSSTLTMIRGAVDATSGMLILGTDIGNIGTLNYTEGSIVGQFGRWVNATGTSMAFPVGTSSNVHTAYITFTDLTPGSLLAEFIASDPGKNGLPLDDGISPDSIRNTFVEGYWILTAANSLASTDYDLQLLGTGFTSFTINSATRILKRSSGGNPWTMDGIHAAAVGETAKRDALNGFAQFAFGDSSNCNPPGTSIISGTDSVCSDDSGISYSVTNTPGSSYNWTITGGSVATGQGLNNITVNWASTGMAGNVRVVETNSCSQGAPIDHAVNIHSLPTSSITGFNEVGQNSSGELYSVTARSGYTYTWTITGGALASGQGTDSISVNWGAQGSGNVRCVGSTDCGNASPVDLAITIYGIITSKASGPWNDTATWDCSCEPPKSASVVIASPYTVTLAAATTVHHLTIDGTLDDDGNKMTATGNLIVDGAYTGSQDLTLKGTSTVNLGGTGSISLTGGKFIKIAGGNVNIPSSANLTVSSGDLRFDKAGISVINSGTITFNFNIVNGMGSVSWTNGANSTLNIGGSIDGNFTASATGNTVNYNGSGDQNIKVPTGSYYNLFASGGGIKTLQANTTVLGNLTISSVLDVDLTNNYSIDLTGNWNNSGTFNEQNGTVTFDGSGAQSITNTAGETFYNLSVNKASGTLTLSNGVTVSNILTMTAGNIDASTNSLTLGTGIGNPGTLSHTSGTIVGTFERWINTPGVGILFPIGTSSDYRPALATFTDLTSGSLIIQFTSTDPGVGGLSLADGSDTVFSTFTEGYWELTAANSLASTSYDLELTGNGFTSSTITAGTRLLTRASGVTNWTVDGTHVSASGNTAKRFGIATLSAECAFGDTARCTAPVTSAISGRDSVCINETGVAYSVTNVAGNTYTWTITGGTVASGQNTDSITVNWGSAGGAGNVRVVESSNCGSGSPVDLAINIHPLATSSITGKSAVTEFTNGEPYSVTSRSGYSYTWTITGGSVASGQGSASITVNWGAQGSGNVNVVASSACGSAAPIDLPVTIYGSITSIASGNWNDTTTWDCSCDPLSSANIVIATLHTVTLTTNDTVQNLTINNGGILDNSSFELVVTGDYNINGTHTGSGDIVLNGASSDIDGSGNITNSGLLRIVASNKSILATANFTKSSGDLNIAAGISITNNGTITIGTNIVGLSATSTFINGANAVLNSGGTVLTTGILDVSASGNTVNYNSSADQNIKVPSSSYANLTASGSGTKTLTGNTAVSGNVQISSSLDADVAGNYTLNVGGNWNNTGTFEERSGTVTFDGSGAQSITNASGETFYGFIVNKSAGTLTLNNNVVVSNTLTMTAGNVDAGANKLTLGTSTLNTGTLSHTSGSVLGNFERWVSSTGVSILFPVGTTIDYRPASITFADLTPGSLVSDFVETDPGTNGLPLTDGAFTVDATFTEGYWTLSTANSLASTNYDLSLTGNGFTSSSITSQTRLLTRSSAASAWTLDGSHIAASGNTARRSSITTLSAEYALGDTSCLGPTTSPITGIDSVCTNDVNIAYSVTNNTGSTYTWVITGGSIASGQGNNSILVDWGATGMTGSVIVTETDGCGVSGSSVDTAVNIHTLLTSSISGNSVVSEFTTGEAYSVTATAGYTYTWTITGPGTLMAGQGTNNITVDWGAQGAGNVNVVGSSGCGSAPGVDLGVTIFGTITSVATGDWSATATWSCGCVPATNGNVTVANTYTVTLTANTTINNLTIDAGGTVDNGSNTLTVSGTYEVNGIHSGTGDINLDDSSIDGTGTISNSGVLRIRNGNKTIASTANLTKPAGNISILAGLTITNNGTITIGGDIVGGNASSTWVNGPNSTLNPGGDVLVIGTLDGSATGNTINYDDNIIENIKSATYNTLNIGGTGTKTLAGNIVVKGNLNISGTLDVSASNYNIEVEGNWTNTGTFNERSSTVTFTGSNAQLFTDTGGTFYNLTINKSSAVLTMASTITVTNNLSLTNGIVKTFGKKKLIITGPAATITGGSPTSFIDGAMERMGTGNKFFPVGRDNIYRPIELFNITGTSPTLSVKIFNINSNGKAGTGIGALSYVRYWKIFVSSGSFTSADQIKITFGPDDNVASLTKLRVGLANDWGHRTDFYNSIGNFSTTGNISNGAITSDASNLITPPSNQKMFFMLGTIKVPVTKLQNTYCGIILSNLNDLIHCEVVPAANDYQYLLTDTATQQQLTGTRGGPSTGFYLTWISGVKYNTVYDVQVRAIVAGVDTGSYGTKCQLTTPDISTKLQPAYCGITLTNIDDLMYCEAVSIADYYQYLVTDTATQQQFTLWGGPYTRFKLTWINDIQYNTVYDVQVRVIVGSDTGSYSAICQVTTPDISIKLQPAYCGITLTNIDDLMYCEAVSIADYYQYLVTDTATQQQFTLWGGPYTRFKLTWINDIQYNTVYDVQVRVIVGSDTGSYGAICQVTTPDISTKLQPAYCGITLTNIDDLMYCEAVSIADYYQYLVTDTATQQQFTLWGGPYTRFKLTWMNEVKYCTVYEVQVRVITGSDTGQYGVVCKVTTPDTCTQARLGSVTSIRFINADKKFSLVLYPNPSDGSNINVIFESEIEKDQKVNLFIFNIYGQQVYWKEVYYKGGKFEIVINLKNELSPGIYLLNAIVNNRSYQKKLIIK